MDLTKVIAEEAPRIDEVMRQDIGRLSQDLDPLLILILEYGLFSGGKRIRPLLTILSARLCGCRDEAVYHLGVACEYLHAATLFHDDVIDNADERRGKTSIFRRFGLNAAVLAGDFLHAHSMSLVGRYGGQEALAAFCGATRGMVDGEFIQLRNADNLNQQEDDYFAVVMRKTALLIGAACEIGAIFGGGDEQMRAGLRTYGLKLGCAFQIVDDLLDYLGSPDKTGKRVGNDLLEAKMTLPLIYALQRADENDRAELLRILADAQKRRSSLAQVSALIAGYDGFIDARRKAEQIIEEALAPLADFATGSPEKELLQALCSYVLNREQ
jgi:octaprenyl-diphosphate synthase